MLEKITHAAVKTTGKFICIGKSHADCFYQGKSLGFEMSNKSASQGFMTNTGRFVDRAEAAQIAKKAKQLDPKDKRTKKLTHLLSEDIWYQKTIIYCYMRGYCRIKEM